MIRLDLPTFDRPDHRDLGQPVTRKLAGARGARDELSGNLQRAACRQLRLVAVARQRPPTFQCVRDVARVGDIVDDRRGSRAGSGSASAIFSTSSIVRHQVRVERVEHVLRDVRQVLLVVAAAG